MKASEPSGCGSWRLRTPGSRSWSPTRRWTSTCSRSWLRGTSDPERRRRTVGQLQARFGVSSAVPVAWPASTARPSVARSRPAPMPSSGCGPDCVHWRGPIRSGLADGLASVAPRTQPAMDGVNHKHIRRLWREEACAAQSGSANAAGSHPSRPDGCGHSDPTRSGRSTSSSTRPATDAGSKLATIVDQHTRQDLAMRVGQTCTAGRAALRSQERGHRGHPQRPDQHHDRRLGLRNPAHDRCHTA